MRKFLLILLILILSQSLKAQTVLSPGDIALISYQTDNPDRFAFVSLVDIAESTTITFTDNSWDGSSLLTSEGTCVWKAPKGGIKKGTVIQIQGTTVTSNGGETGEAFHDDFETGDLSNWSLEADSGNTVAINTDTVNNGTYSALINYIGAYKVAKMSIGVDNLESIYFRAYIYISLGFNAAPLSWANVNFVTFFDGSIPVIRLWGKSANEVNNYKIRNWNVWANDIGEFSGADWDGIASKFGTWARLEVGWERGTGSDGWIEIRVDGDSICGLNGLSQTSLNVDSIKIGNFRVTVPGSGSYFYVDDIVIDTTDWVGPRGGIVMSNSIDLNDQGDQIFAYQGSSINPSFIDCLSSDAWLTSGSANENRSYLPPSLIEGITARDFPIEFDNGYFNISNNSDTKENLLSLINNINNWTLSDAVQSWPSWFFNVDNTLPVELSSFTAKVLRSGGVQLNWRTETEVSNYGFDIERSQTSDVKGQTEWTMIDFVEGHGNSNSPKDYSFTDNSIGYGKYSYRLKQIDADGQFEYSKVVEVDAGNIPGGFVLEQNYPNPFNPTTTIKFAVAETQSAKLIIYDVLGNEVAIPFNGTAEGGKLYETEFSGENLSSGIYFYRLETDNRVENRKMLLLK